MVKKPTKLAVESGFYFSIPSVITRSKGRQDMLKRFIPADKIMLETDAPYMSPFDVAEGESRIDNESANIKYSVPKIAELFEVEEKQIWDDTTQRAKTFFKIE